jgi:hypothetical protein
MSGRIIWRGAEAKAKARAGAVRGLGLWAEDVLTASQPLVPVSPNTGGGLLRDSGTTTVDAGSLSAAISYDGPADKPALPVWVHENMANSHETGEAKFLEKPLNASKQSGPATVAREIKAAL